METSYPSKFIMSSDYATLKNDAEATATLTLPNSVAVNAGAPNIVYKTDIKIGASKASGARYFVESSKCDFAIASSSFSIGAKLTSDGYTEDADVIGVVYRVNGDTFRLEVDFPSSPNSQNVWSGMAQTLTLHIQTFIDPFM